jgi:hypothetical protein
VLSEIRVRSRITAEAMEQRKQKVLTEEAHDIRLTGPTRVTAPDGRPLCVYLPGAVKEQMDGAYPILTTIRGLTENRGYASGTAEKFTQNNLQRAKPVMSSILGSFESSGFYKFCRLTSWTAAELEGRWPQLLPLLEDIADEFAFHVPDRYAAQKKAAGETAPEWLIPGTPFTTITVNNTFPTGVHKDAGDLDAGFSCLAVARRGNFTGGMLTFPEFRIAVDMQDGDLILMDAHQWHGNTRMTCECGREMDGSVEVLNGRELSDGPCPGCGAERISVVCYYRTKMAACGTADEEQQKAMEWGERWNQPKAEATS